MSTDMTKVPCIHCGVLILPRTAEKWGGLCGRCDTRREQGLPPPNMSLDVSPAQQQHFLSIAAAIFGEDNNALSACKFAFEDWKAFYERHPVEHHDPRDGAPDPVDLLVDVATAHEHLFEADCRAFASEVIQGVSELKRFRALTVDWQSITADDDSPLELLLSQLTSLLASQEVTLLMINKLSDSYPLCVASPEAAQQAVAAADALGKNYVILAANQFCPRPPSVSDDLLFGTFQFDTNGGTPET